MRNSKIWITKLQTNSHLIHKVNKSLVTVLFYFFLRHFIKIRRSKRRLLSLLFIWTHISNVSWTLLLLSCRFPGSTSNLYRRRQTSACYSPQDWVDSDCFHLRKCFHQSRCAHLASSSKTFWRCCDSVSLSCWCGSQSATSCWNWIRWVCCLANHI